MSPYTTPRAPKVKRARYRPPAGFATEVSEREEKAAFSPTSPTLAGRTFSITDGSSIITGAICEEKGGADHWLVHAAPQQYGYGKISVLKNA
jgi:hypothetical protein